MSDPVLSSFPRLLGDHHLLMEFLVKWRDATTKLTVASDVGRTVQLNERVHACMGFYRVRVVGDSCGLWPSPG